MMKLKILVLFFVFSAFSAQAEYSRKLKEPEFFIPEQNRMHQPENLPKIVNKKIVKEDKSRSFNKIPEYKRKYAEYVNDVNIFANTGKMPENNQLNEDLKAMESGEVFEITNDAPIKIETSEQQLFEKIVQDNIKN